MDRLSRQAAASRLAGAAVLLLGSGAVAQAAWDPGWIRRAEAGLHVYSPEVAPGSLALLGLCLLVTGRGLLLRRSNARWVAVGLLLADSVAGLRWGRGTVPGMGSALLAVLVIASWTEYSVPRARDVTPAFTKLLGLAAAADLVCGCLLTAVGRALPEPYEHPLAVGRVVVDGLAGRRVWIPDPSAGHWLLPVLTAAGGLSVLLLLAVVMAPPVAPVDGTRPRPSLVRMLGDREEGDTLDPFALRPDKLHFLAGPPGGQTAVGYRPIFGVALASGPPVGPSGDREEALRAYLGHCAAHGWRPAFIALGAEEAAACRRLGLRTLAVGDEAVVEVASFRLDTPAMRNVRQAVKRTHNFGVTTSVLREGEVEAGLRAGLLSLSAHARDGAPEQGFSMGLGEPFAGQHPDALVVVARDRDGRPVAFQRYAPCRAGRALSLDIMRRSPDAPNGVNERMIADVISWAGDNGVEEVSLNFAAFRELMDLGEARSRWQRVEYWLVHRIDRWVKVESLYRFNAKFRPRWVPRYVAFRARDLGWVAMAALTAEFSLRVDRLSVRSAPDWMPAPAAGAAPSH